MKHLWLIILLVGCPPTLTGDDTETDVAVDDDDTPAPDDDDTPAPDDDDDTPTSDDDDDTPTSDDDDDTPAPDDDDDSAVGECEEPLSQYVPESDVWNYQAGWVTATVVQWPPGPGPEVVADQELEVGGFELSLWDSEVHAGPHISQLPIAVGDAVQVNASALDEYWQEGWHGLATADGELLYQVGYQVMGDASGIAFGVSFGAPADCVPVYAGAVADVGGYPTQRSVVISDGASSIELDPGEQIDAFGYRIAVNGVLEYTYPYLYKLQNPYLAEVLITLAEDPS